jgi:hypothetical protein
MLKILSEQLEHFARRARRDFADRVVLHLTLTFPAHLAALTPEELRARVEDGLARAEAHGIVMEPDVLEFIVMLFALGPAADEEIPWVRDIVRDRGLDGSGKVRRLEETGRRVLGGTSQVEESP